MRQGFHRLFHRKVYPNVRQYTCAHAKYATNVTINGVVRNTRPHILHCSRWSRQSRSQIHVCCTAYSQPGIFTPSKKGVEVPFVIKPDLNLEALFGPDYPVLEKSLDARGKPANLKGMIKMWEDLRNLQLERGKIESARQKNRIKAKELSKKKVPVDSPEVISHRHQGKSLRENLKLVNSAMADIQDQLYPEALSLPNLLHADVPIGRESRVREMIPGSSVKADYFNFDDGNKLVSTNHDLVHPGACYLEGDLAHVEQRLLDQAEEYLLKKGFHLMSCPDMIKPYMLDALGQDYKEREEVYHIDTKEHQTCLTGLSPLNFYAYYMMSVVETGDLPERCFSVGRSYNAKNESEEFEGLHSHFQGLQVQLFSLFQNSPQEEEAQFTHMMTLVQDYYRDLGIPYRVVDTASENLMPAVHRRQAIELWLYSMEGYQEIAHVSSCSDYVTRRLMIKHPSNPFQSAANSRDRKYAYSIHGTALNCNVLLEYLLHR